MLYRSFRAEGFRCFEDIELKDVERINLITGKNNVGKTALLEAVFIHSGLCNPSLVMTIDGIRGLGSKKLELGPWTGTLWDFVFRNFDTSRKIVLTGHYGGGLVRTVRIRVIRKPDELRKISHRIRLAPEEPKERPISAPTSREVAQVLEFEYRDESGETGQSYMVVEPAGARMEAVPPPPYPGYYQGSRGRVSPSELADKFSKLEIKMKKDSLLRALQIVEPDLKDITLASAGAESILYGEKAGLDRLMPLNLMGDGITRIADLVLAMAGNPNGVVLWDEVENGIHHSILGKLWETIDQISKEFNVQLFLTTHSYECIMAAHRSFSAGESYPFAMYRLERIDNNVQVFRYDKRLFEAAADTALEVR